MAKKAKVKLLQKQGLEFCVIKTCEELGETIQALAKVYIGKWPVAKLAQEIADCEIMFAQIKILYNIQNAVPKAKEVKLKKLEKKNKI